MHLARHWAEFLALYGREPRGIAVTYPMAADARDGRRGLTLDGVRGRCLPSARRDPHLLLRRRVLHPPVPRSGDRDGGQPLGGRGWLDREPRLLAATVTPRTLEESPGGDRPDRRRRPASSECFCPRGPRRYGNRRSGRSGGPAQHRLALTINYRRRGRHARRSRELAGQLLRGSRGGDPPFQAHVMSLTFSGVFDRHPRSHRRAGRERLDLAAAADCGGWIRSGRPRGREVPWLEEPPSRYVRRHFRLRPSRPTPGHLRSSTGLRAAGLRRDAALRQ